ncbi:MAG: tRNA (adenosine(37)-N6)-dimethylallyltransferase MiaA [Gammaproteobacteria bacterium]|nr:tRNA (adenosine(37)-N6)-dimethylallyltransferase MiaA [Gammaproteobacteria bacterium]
MGPTASGKTDLALHLAARLPCDIISVDSGMVYRGMDIGTAKPSPDALARAPHRLIDIRDPAEPYSAAQFSMDALREMEEITQRGRIPLLVGGTLLYFRALERGLAEMPGADSTLRARLCAEAQQRGWAALHTRLARLDPASAARIHPNDAQRVQRALEVCELHGGPMSELHRAAPRAVLPYRIQKIALAPAQRAVLHERIGTRFHDMLQRGFIEEVKALKQRGDLSLDTPALRAVGYRQVWQHLHGEFNCEEMAKRAIIATRQLAKRQLTWLRAEPGVTWFDSMDTDITAKVLNYCADAST